MPNKAPVYTRETLANIKPKIMIGKTILYISKTLLFALYLIFTFLSSNKSST